MAPFGWRLVTCSLAAALTLGATVASADDKSDGCGPGWWVTKTTSFSATTTRATTNSYVRPFAMTSGTSGCAKHSLVMNGKRLEFIQANKDQLALETALGQGEFLSAFAASMGCAPELNAAFSAALRSHYGDVFAPAADAETVLRGAERVVRAEPALARCGV